MLLLFFAVVPAIFAVAAVVDVTAAVVAAAAAVVVAAAATDISKTESFFFHPNLFLLSLSHSGKKLFLDLSTSASNFQREF